MHAAKAYTTTADMMDRQNTIRCQLTTTLTLLFSSVSQPCCIFQPLVTCHQEHCILLLLWWRLLLLEHRD